MGRAKVAITLDPELLEQLDRLVARQMFPNRSSAIEEAVEEKLAHTRTLYNAVVLEWNNRIAAFPPVLVARTCGYRLAPPFAGDDAPLPPRLRQPEGLPASR